MNRLYTFRSAFFFLLKHKIARVQHTPYGPDFSDLLDFFLYPNLKI